MLKGWTMNDESMDFPMSDRETRVDLILDDGTFCFDCMAWEVDFDYDLEDVGIGCNVSYWRYSKR